MALVVSAVVTSIGAAVGASLLGTSVGILGFNIGAALGAGIAGGLYAEVRGGDFWSGFAGGALGNIGGELFFGADGFLSGFGGDSISASASNMPGGVSSNFSSDAFLTPGSSTEFLGDITQNYGGDLASGGLENLGAVTSQTASGLGQGAAGSTGLGELFSNGGGAATGSTGGFSPSGNSFSLENLGIGDYSGLSSDTLAAGAAPSFNMGGNLSVGEGAAGIVGDTASASSTSSVMPDINPGPSGAYLENVLSPQAAAPAAGGLAGTLSKVGQGFRQGISSADAMFGQVGLPKGTAAKSLWGGIDYIAKERQLNSLQKSNNALYPQSLQEYQNQNYNPDDYRAAANQLARSGHSGSLPVLLARAKQRAGQGYAQYKNTAGNQYLANKAAIQTGRNTNLGNLFGGIR